MILNPQILLCGRMISKGQHFHPLLDRSCLEDFDSVHLQQSCCALQCTPSCIIKLSVHLAILETSRTTNKCQTCLKHAKRSLNVLPCELLSFSNILGCCPLWTWNYFHKCLPRGIYAISKMVSYCIVMVIN
jgi:hypothetical protein